MCIKFNSGELDWLVQNSRLRIEASAIYSKRSLEEESAVYRQILENARKEGLAYTLESDEQIVLAPAFGGRFWRVGVMGSAEAGRKFMEEVKMLPEAAQEFTYNLIQAPAEAGLSMIVPCQIAKINGEFVIVR